MTDSPAPGSDAALDAGCRCPVLDNAHGLGYLRVPGVYVKNVDCPLHGILVTATRGGTLYVNSHADEPRCAGCGQHHTPINQHGYCLGCWLALEDQP